MSGAAPLSRSRWAGVPAQERQAERRWDRLTLEEQVVMNTACAVYQHCLWREPRALAYVRARVPDWVIRHCAVGYADGHSLEAYLRRRSGLSIAQELGLIGAAAVLLLFLALVARAMRVALVAHDGFSKLLAAGLAFGFALQTFIIVGGVLRLVPLTGITLPFVSYGGSSIVSNFVMLALLMLVSHRAVRTAPT